MKRTLYIQLSLLHLVMKKVVLSILLFGSMGAFAQNDSISNDILTTKKYRAGIFVKYAEFKTNSPSIEKGFKITADTGKYDRYILHFNKGAKIRNAYAFSDGKDLFINAKVYDQSNYFVKILLLGPITYFEDKRAAKNLNAAFFGASVVGALASVAATELLSTADPLNPGWILYLPDDDGEAYVLDKTNLQSIFKEANFDLLKRFKAEKENTKLEVLLRYVKEFNELSLNKK